MQKTKTKKRNGRQPWLRIQQQRNFFVKAVKWGLAALLVTVTLVISTSVLLKFTNWFWLPLLGFLVSLFLLAVASLASLFVAVRSAEVMRKFMKELNQRRETKIEFPNLPFMLRGRYIRLYFMYFSLTDLADVLIEFDRTRRREPTEQQKAEREYHVRVNSVLEEALEFLPTEHKITARVKRALRNSYMDAISKRLLLEEVIGILDQIHRSPGESSSPEASLLKNRLEQNKPVVEKARAPKRKRILQLEPVPAKVEAKAEQKLWDLEKFTIRWETIESFDLDLIPEQYRPCCGHILFYLCVYNLGTGTFKHESYDRDAVASFVHRSSGHKKQVYYVEGALQLLVSSGLIRENREHHNRKRGRDFYKVNLSPKEVNPEFKELHQRLCQELL